MKILYRQPTNSTYPIVGNPPVLLTNFGITNCYFKKILTEADLANTIKGFHHHNDYEIHMIISGSQTYETQTHTYTVNAGSFLVIPPNVTHKLSDSIPDTLKFSITFSAAENLGDSAFYSFLHSCAVGSISLQSHDCINFINIEAERQREFSQVLIGGRILEILVSIARALGMKEHFQQAHTGSEDFRLTLAKQFIKDNIDRRLTVYEIAQYCRLSEKQLTRLFTQIQGCTPSAYIYQQKIARIRQFLADDTLTLKDISEQMNFSSEYYFNAFFKKHSGTTPGAYRKMINQMPF